MTGYDGSINMTAFLFGNINKMGQLEANDKDLVSINRLEDCRIQDFNNAIDSIFTQPHEEVNETLISDEYIDSKGLNQMDYYDEDEVIEIDGFNSCPDKTTIKMNSYTENDEDYDDCMIIEPPENPVNELPLLTEQPFNSDSIPNINKTTYYSNLTNYEPNCSNLPLNLTENNPGMANYTNSINYQLNGSNFQLNPNENNKEMINFTNGLNIQLNPNTNNKGTIHYKNLNTSQFNNPNIQSNENVNNLNTPLANIMPQEYIDVNIQSLFPDFKSDKVLRWSKLFGSFHQSQPYDRLNQVKSNPPEEIFIDLSNENQNCAYDDYGINMGIIPQDDVILTNDADLFSLPAQSFEDCEVNAPFRIMQQRIDNINFNHINHISNTNELTNNLTKKGNLQQEIKRKRKRYDKLNKLKSNISEESNVSKIEILTGLKWRSGPASYWYDLFNVPLDENILEHRIKCNVESNSDLLANIEPECLKDEDCSFSTWELVNWESDVIIDGETSRNDILESNRKFACHAGWIPSSTDRNMASFQDSKNSDYFGIWPASSTGTLNSNPNFSQWHSVFALENAQMSECNWITKIIIDPRHDNVQEPYILELDLNNESIHFDFTNPQQTKEILISELNSVYLSTPNNLQSKITDSSATDHIDIELNPNNHENILNKEKQIKKMKILNKITELNEKEPKINESKLEPILNTNLSLVKYIDRDVYVSSNDYVDNTGFHMDTTENEVYNIPPIDAPLIRYGIQHSLSAIQIDSTFFPLKLENQYLRHMHRFQLSDVKQAMIPLFITPQPIYNLTDLVKIESDQRQKICQLTGNGDLFFMRTINDLSACTDHIVLAEYSEEFPPLMMQTGMATRITNYFNGQLNQPVNVPQLPYGDLCVTQHIPFLGQLSENQIFQALENNMFRAPIYPHKLKSTDFLIIIKSNTISIRRINDIFLVGQELPLMEVPAPNSRKANSFIKDFMQVQMIRLFLKSQIDPKTIRHDEIKAMFSEQSDSALRKRLRIFADYKKSDIGSTSGCWVLKPEFQLPTEEELTELITPEECCAYYSMMAGLCRLEDAGYNSKSFMQTDPEQQDEDDDKEGNLKIEDEVKAAPWHTTKTYCDSQRGKCILELLGSTDPTGCSEAFSYSKVSAKGSLFKESLKSKINQPLSLFGRHAPTMGKRMLTGTDADLRKLTLTKAYGLLKECGISQHDFKKLKRWDIIDLVREMSTQKAKQGDEEALIKYARSSKVTTADQEEKYKSECQRIFNLQNQVLANDDELTSDDGESDEDDGFCDDYEKSIFHAFDKRRRHTKNETKLLKANKPSENTFDIISEINNISNGTDKSYKCPATPDNARNILKFKAPVPKALPKALCIRRQIESSDGTKITHCQTIPWSTIVKIYFKMNEEHNSEYLREFSGLNISKAVEKKALQKQQEKIRRLKRQQKAKLNAGHASLIDVVKKYRPLVIPTCKVKGRKKTIESSANLFCGSCGNKGHMRTNKDCPLYGKNIKKVLAKRPFHKPCKIQSAQVEAVIESFIPDKESITSIITHDIDFIDLSVNAGDVIENDCVLLDTNDVHKEVNIDVHNDIFSNTEEPMDTCTTSVFVDTPDSNSLKMVISKQSISQLSSPSSISITQPQSIIINTEDIKDCTIDDISHPVNGRKRKLSSDKKPPISKIIPGVPLLSAAKQNEIILEQKMRGNRRRIDPLVALNHQFEEIYKDLLHVPGYRSFLHPVRSKECPNYYSIVDYPMDLSTIKMRINKNYYESRESFIQDIKLIYDNCLKYNGESSEISSTAKKLMSHVMEQFCVKERKLMRLEKLANPLMDEDDMVGMRYILEQTLKAMEEVEYSRPFYAPVNTKKYPDYLEKISHPMDFQTIRSNIKADKYKSREDFLIDAELILSNCITYNGKDSFLTSVCQKVLNAVQHIFNVKEATLNTLEANLKMTLDDASDSLVAAGSCVIDQLSHVGDDHLNEEISNEIESLTPSVKRQRLSESYEEEKVGSISTSASVDANRERIMADLQLTDSEEEDDNREHISACIRLESEDRVPRNAGFQPANDRLRDHSTSLEDKSNLYHYQNSENNSEAQESPAHVTFYISDDD